jgi:hypothetical protein
MARSVLVILMAATENHLKSRHYWLAQNNAGWPSRQTGLQGCQQGILKSDHCTIDLLFDWFGISCMTSDNFLFLFAKQTNPDQ